jgi:protoporphyrinogen oxidase
MADPRSAASSRTADAIGSVIVIGAGPAGLTAAYELTRLGVRTTVFDQDQRVGGLAQTASYKGFRFDIGGHRFFTKLPLVQALWRQMLGADFLKRPRLSRIYYGGKFFHYPLKATNTLGNLGVFTSLAVLVSYARAKVSPVHPVVSFEDWISNKFGRKLFEMFFKSYTEKVWGIPCNQISAEWAAQRIKGLSLRTALLNMIMGDRGRLWTKGSIKTLIGEFEYPRLGPGMMWEAFRDRIVRVEIERDGQRTTHAADHVIATMPVRELASVLTPALPQEALDAANRLAYRDFVTVAIVVRQRDVFPDNWIYIHDPSVQVGRIQNFKNWSPEMVPDAAMTCLGLEYFCSEGDALWSLSDEAFVDLARREVVQIGLAAADAIVDGAVVRAKKAYPVYDAGYVDALNIVRRHLKPLANLQLIGRNGMHKYNNQDHSMLTAFLAVRNLLGERHDLWAVNADDEYHEELSDIEIGANAEAVELSDIRALAETQPRVPIRIESAKS